MNKTIEQNKSLLISGLSIASLLLLVVIYYTPIWWVALTAPNYPEEAFPDGVRINFHMNGVFNGCSKVEKAEIIEEEALDCVHEMDTINHYVGMYPIAAGGPVERGFSQFLFVLLAIMIVGFMLRNTKIRIAFMGGGYVILSIWMYMTLYGGNGFHLLNEGYVSAMVTYLDQDATDKSVSNDDENSTLAALKKSLEASGIEVEKTPEQIALEEKRKNQSEKERLVEQLQITYEKDLEKGFASEAWDGSAAQVMVWHYGKTLGRYFNKKEEIEPMVKTLSMAINVIFFALIAAMAFLVYIATRPTSILFWLLVAVPAALPIFFVIDYAAWLWWYGHTLNDMGAFSVKPFMPTVFGVGKVAQFSTYSYPNLGYFLILLNSVILGAVMLLSRNRPK